MDNSLDGWIARSYDEGCAAARRWVDGLDLDTAARERIRFATEQWLAAAHPRNFLATNGEAIRRAVETHGASLAEGMRIMLADVARGHVANTDEAAFEVGRDLANTPGAVVMRNELVELIQYAPATRKVGARPLFIVPPCINKFYILDLGVENSFVRHCVAAGHTVFMVSWRNPGTRQASLTWDDYLRLGVVEPMAAVREISAAREINALGFCVGGTILACALAALAADGEPPVASLTLLATLLDFSDVGPIGVFIDPATVALREATLGHGGLMSGRELASAFASLRPAELIWNYVARGYLQGERPPAFDLLYWNADSTNLPGPMAAWYLRNLYLENRLGVPGALTCLDRPVDLGRLRMPACVVATREDHIVPWRSAFRSAQLLGGKTQFILGASGHIAGIVNPPQRRKRCHWIAGPRRRARASDADAWFASAQEHAGSWWPRWTDWLAGHSGGEVPAPRVPGGGRHRPLALAPGDYVKVRLDQGARD